MGWDTTPAAAPFDIVDPTTGKNVGIIDEAGIHWYDPNNGFFHAVDINAGGIEINAPNGAGTSMQQDSTGTTFTQSPPNSGAVDPVFNASMHTTIGAGPDYRPYCEWQAPAINKAGNHYGKRRMYGPGEQTATSDTKEYADSFEVISAADNVTSLFRTDSSGIKVLGKSAPQGVLGYWYANAGTLIGTTSGNGNEVPLTAWNANSSGAVTINPGRICKLSYRAPYFNDAVSDEDFAFTLRVREGLNSTTGTQLAFFRKDSRIARSVVLSLEGHEYIQNNGNAPVQFTPSFTILYGIGTGGIHLYGDSNLICDITIEDIGAATDLRTLASRAVTV